MSGNRKTAVVDKNPFIELGNLNFADVVTSRDDGKKRGARRLDRPIVKVPLEEIVEDSPAQQRRETFDPKVHSEDNELLQSVSENGVLEPIMLARISELGSEAKYRIVFGHRRVAAARSADLEEITAIIATKDDDVDLLTLVENTGGRALTPYEKALSLVEIKGKKPELTTRKLGKLTGIRYTHVSDLIRAYKNSTPALRGLFAEGAGARTIVVLQPVFDKLNESEQKSLCSDIKGISTRDAQEVRDLVEGGLAPENAAKTVIGGRQKPEKTKNKNPTERTNLPNKNENSQIAALALYSGASEKTVEQLLKKVARDGSSLRAVTFACAYKARGGGRRDALQLAERVAADRKLSAVIHKHLDNLAKSRKALKVIDDQNVAKFVTTVLSGDSHGS